MEIKIGDTLRIKAGYEEYYRDYQSVIGYKWPEPLFKDGEIVIATNVLIKNVCVYRPGDGVHEAVPRYLLEKVE